MPHNDVIWRQWTRSQLVRVPTKPLLEAIKNIFNFSTRNKRQQQLNQNTYVFCQEIIFETSLFTFLSILCKSHCLKALMLLKKVQMQKTYQTVRIQIKVLGLDIWAVVEVHLTPNVIRTIHVLALCDMGPNRKALRHVWFVSMCRLWPSPQYGNR